MPDRIGYQLIQPPGWIRLDIEDTSGKEIRDFARYAAAASAPAVRPQLESLIREQLGAALRKARDIGGQDLFMPTELVQGLPLPMSIVVSASPPLPASTEVGSGAALLAFASAHDTSEAIEIDGSLAVRSVTTTAPSPGSSDATQILGSRRISYLVDAPTPLPRLFVVSCTIMQFPSDVDGTMTDALEFLSDAIVETIRFERVEADA
jgi:hypothetical protein